LIQYIIDRGLKGRLLIRNYDCFTVVNKEDKMIVLRTLIASIGFTTLDQVYMRGYHLSSIGLATVNPGVLTGVKICSGFR